MQAHFSHHFEEHKFVLVKRIISDKERVQASYLTFFLLKNNVSPKNQVTNNYPNFVAAVLATADPSGRAV